MSSQNILVLYTGGTIGMTRPYAAEPLRPIHTLEEIFAHVAVPPGVNLTFLTANVLIDSTDMTHAYRLQQLRHILRQVTEFDGVLFLQGTDTLAETCAFMSLAWNQEGAPFVVVGSQLPFSEPGSDAAAQLGNALRACTNPSLRGGVYTVSMGQVLHGARVRKRHHSSPHAFHTPGLAPALELGPPERYNFLAGNHSHPHLSSDTLKKMADCQVAHLIASAENPPSLLLNMLEGEAIQAVILEARGAGNIPTVPWKNADGTLGPSWVDAIHTATRLLAVTVAIRTPFEEGTVDFTQYVGGAAAAEAGALSLGSMTPAMADVKLRAARALYWPDQAKMQDYLLKNHVGEHIYVQ